MTHALSTLSRATTFECPVHPKRIGPCRCVTDPLAIRRVAMGLWRCPNNHTEVAGPNLGGANSLNCIRCGDRLQRVAVGIYNPKGGTAAPTGQ